jgi:hypothetical protein
MHQEHLQAQGNLAHLIGDHQRRISALERRADSASST